jgi:hypothetical protein
MTHDLTKPETSNERIDRLSAAVTTAEQEAAHWKSIALYLADCHAATAYGLPKSTGKSARARFKNICESALKMIEGTEMPPSLRRGLEDVADRLRGGMREDT